MNINCSKNTELFVNSPLEMTENWQRFNCSELYFNFQPLMPAAQMVLFVWLLVRAILRGQWRSAIMESGALPAMTAGTGMMLQWSINSWGSREQVSWEIVTISNTRMHAHTLQTRIHAQMHAHTHKQVVSLHSLSGRTGYTSNCKNMHNYMTSCK